MGGTIETHYEYLVARARATTHHHYLTPAPGQAQGTVPTMPDAFALDLFGFEKYTLLVGSGRNALDCSPRLGLKLTFKRINRTQAKAHINSCQVELLLLREGKNLFEFDQSIVQRVGIIRTAQVGYPTI